MDSSYMDDVDPIWYLTWAYGGYVCKEVKYVCAILHDIFRNKVSGSDLLDIGCGPGLLIPIAARTKFEHMVMADYNPKHHQYIRRWLDGNESGFDWDEYMDIFADLDSESDKEAYRNGIKAHMRECIKDICYADVSQPNPLVKGEMQQFDVVTALYLFEALKCVDMKTSIANVANLLKPGGTFLIVSDIEATSYYDINHDFVLSGTKRTFQDFQEALAAAGLTIVQKEFRENDEPNSDSKGTIVLRTVKEGLPQE